MFRRSNANFYLEETENSEQSLSVFFQVFKVSFFGKNRKFERKNSTDQEKGDCLESPGKMTSQAVAPVLFLGAFKVKFCDKIIIFPKNKRL
jgi:hypothetical protein